MSDQDAHDPFDDLDEIDTSAADANLHAFARAAKLQGELNRQRQQAQRAAGLRPAPKPAELIEVDFTVYDRTASGYRTLNRALTPRDAIKLARDILDSAAGVTNLAELADDTAHADHLTPWQCSPVLSPGSNSSLYSASREHDPFSNQFYNTMNNCLVGIKSNLSRARNRGYIEQDQANELFAAWLDDHSPWVVRTMQIGTGQPPLLGERANSFDSDSWYLSVPVDFDLCEQSY